MAKPLLPDELWAVTQPVLPVWTPSPKGGPPRLDDRKALLGILFVLKTGIGWEDLPWELGCGCGMTCWRRLAEWQADGTWANIHAVLLARPHAAGKIDWSRAAWTARPRGPFSGGGDGQEPDGPWEEGHQAPPARERQRGAPGRHHHRGEPA